MIDLDPDILRDRLGSALGVRRWVEDVLAAGPYDDVERLIAVARESATPLSGAELDEAVAHHPLIGELASASGLADRSSHGEQAGLGAADQGVDAAIARGNKIYEERFGRVFLIRAAGRARHEVADELQRRLKNDPEVEAEEAKEQLREIMELRLRTFFAEETR